MAWDGEWSLLAPVACSTCLSRAHLSSCIEVVNPDKVPAGVAKERPNAKSKGHWYCIRFFPAGD